MNNDFSELIEYLDQKFTNIDQRFTGIDQRFTGIDQRFTNIDIKLVGLEQNKADKSDVQNKADKSDVEELLNAIDAYAKRTDTYFQEMTVLFHKVDRHEKWIVQIAAKLGIKLDY